MKKRFILICLLTLTYVLLSIQMYSANFINFETKITQPNGTTITCLASGDEFYNRLHDSNGYTIVQGQDGWYYYADKNLKGEVIPSTYKVGEVNPETTSLLKNIKISKAKYDEKVYSYLNPLKTRSNELITKAPANGSFNNIVIYIRFADDAGMTNIRQDYIDLFEGEGLSNYSVKEYFQEVSYNQLTVNAYHFPTCIPSVNLSYQDAYNRGYYQPYNATTNPSGYPDDTEARLREHTLLQNAVKYFELNIEASLTSGQVDMDNDGYVDNISFIVSGGNGEWSDLLWAHRWALYSNTTYIHDKRVWDYTFQPETQSSSRTTCHELFHSIGSPDLYHYVDDGISPVAGWDLMEWGVGHMTAYMKEQIGGWITIPTISSSGTYSLNPVTSSTNNAFKIPSPNSETEFFVVEYRKKQGNIESQIPSYYDDGLIIYRINTLVSIDEGNRNGPPDMLYIYRPNGTSSVDGTYYDAAFSSNQSRTSFNNSTNPRCFLNDNSDGGLNISNVGTAGTTISFTVTLPVSTYDVTFNVTDGTNPVDSAYITFNSVSKYTNVSGSATFNSVEVGSNLPYSITKEGFQDNNGLIDVVNQNVIENITLQESPPLTKLSDEYCGITVSNLSEYIKCIPVVDATNYRYLFDNGSPIEYTVGSGDNKLFLSSVSGLQYGATYTVNVAAYVNGSWTDYGTPCNIIIDNASTNLTDEFCNATLNSLYEYLKCSVLEGATNYKYRFDNGTPIEYTVGSSSNKVYLNFVPGLEYNQTYSVQVAAYVGGEWSSYGAACDIAISGVTTQVSSSYCDISLNSLYSYIKCNPVLNATNYKYIFDNGTPIEYTVGSNSNKVSLNLVPGLEYNQTYSVQVAAYVGGEWSSYGAACDITISGATTQLAGLYCGITLNSLYSYVKCTSVLGATNYKYKFDAGTPIEYVVGSNTNKVYLYKVPGLQMGKTYSVQVAAYAGGGWSNYGNTCQVTILGVRSLDENYGNENLISDVEIYPNPFVNTSTIRINSTNDENCIIRIFNISGQVIFEDNIQSNTPIDFGDRLKAGIYIVSVHNESSYITKKFIKTE